MSGRFMIVVALVACAAVMLLAVNGFAGKKPAAKPDFNKMDTTADKKITEAEFDAYVISSPELGLTKSVFTKWDRDQDGVVTYEEFQVVQPMEEKAAPAGREGCSMKKEAAPKKGGTCPASKAVQE
ncbi:MAG: hypothetical protein NTZ78_10780 [Candidatus Aureabacteria bacterium]|nr:hypothetical protein [Candidatus Auribacterota bacterium]